MTLAQILLIRPDTCATFADSVLTGFGAKYDVVVHTDWHTNARDSIYYSVWPSLRFVVQAIPPPHPTPPWWVAPWLGWTLLALTALLLLAAFDPRRAVEETEDMDPLDADEVIG